MNPLTPLQLMRKKAKKENEALSRQHLINGSKHGEKIKPKVFQRTTELALRKPITC